MDYDQDIELFELEVEKLKSSPSAVVSDEQLDSMSFIQGDTIDVGDNCCASASASPFFQPLGPIGEQMMKIFSRRWTELGDGQAPRVYPACRAGWFMGPWAEKVDLETPWESVDLEFDELEIDSFGGSAWQCLK